MNSGKYKDSRDSSLYLADFTDPNKVNSYIPDIIPGADNYGFLVINFKFGPNKVGIYTGTGTPTDESWNDPSQTLIFTNEPNIVLMLPEQYSNIPLDFENTDRVRTGLAISCRNVEILSEKSLGIPADQRIDPPTVVSDMILGDENAEYSIFTPPEGSSIGINFGMNKDIRWFREGYTFPIIRGPLEPLILPTFYSEIEMSVHFDTTNLVQIYEGPDATPYTHDDVFTFAPEFYKRFRVDYIIH